ncbi:macro domain-containing protein [Symbioplanes lichenis]|uniref:macro domain-containing protein n=1 Tax=Symbioplanes lichenis TaxID=1629072 RepID=UPI0027392212|nr:macro domain-containing protein [Actinoplanes lichenis]
MTDGTRGPDPATLHTLDDLADAFTRLRRRAARPGQVQRSVRDIATRTGRAPSTLDPYLRGLRLCPADVYEEILRALGVTGAELRPWLDAWERIADHRADGAAGGGSRPAVLPYSETFRYRVTGATAELAVITGDLRRVTCAEVWVNSENTQMRMARIEESSVSAVIRFEGADRDGSDQIVTDRIADELEAAVAGRRPVAAGTAVVTGAGGLERNGVRHIVHVAAVRGEPGEGWRPVADLGRCVTNALLAAEELGAATILFPLLGAGSAGGAPGPTAQVMAGAAVDHLTARPGPLRTVYLLASKAVERDACRRVLSRHPLLQPAD